MTSSCRTEEKDADLETLRILHHMLKVDVPSFLHTPYTLHAMFNVQLLNLGALQHSKQVPMMLSLAVPNLCMWIHYICMLRPESRTWQCSIILSTLIDKTPLSSQPTQDQHMVLLSSSV